MSTPPTPREARAAAGLTLQQVADAAGISLSTVHRAEKAGRWPVHFTARQAMSRVLGVDLIQRPAPTAPAATETAAASA